MQQTPDRTQTTPVPGLHPAAEMGTVTLKVADLARSIDFYTRVIGLEVFQQADHAAVLGAGDCPILLLEEVTGAPRPARSATGLYHAAIVLPTRHALAVKVQQLASINYPFGYGDHLVSEAFYLDDPDGNGLELYWDRPRSQWKWNNGVVQMATDPIDFDSLFAEIPSGDPALKNPAMPAGTKLGHMHLRVGNIANARAFYHDVLGFDIVMQMPTALFISAGGYHHHIGMNVWESNGGKPAPEQSTGLREFSISLPDRTELDRLTQQIEAAAIPVEHLGDSALISDPWQNRIKLVLQQSLVRQ